MQHANDSSVLCRMSAVHRGEPEPRRHQGWRRRPAIAMVEPRRANQVDHRLGDDLVIEDFAPTDRRIYWRLPTSETPPYLAWTSRKNRLAASPLRSGRASRRK